MAPTRPVIFLLSALLPLLHLLSTPSSAFSPYNSSLPQPPDPESVVAEFGRKLESARRRALLSPEKDQLQCLTGNPIDDCWRCSGADWRADRQRLADCGVGFGGGALGGKGGQIYVVTDPSDPDSMNPPPGTLRYGAIQDTPLWITFAGDMTIRLSEELLVNSFKTLDGRGAQVHIAGGACITLENVSHVIVHNLHVHHCVPAGHAYVRSSPTSFGYRTRSDGDGVAMFGAREIWIDHCSLSYCANGLVDAIVGSTAITVSNNHFSHHDMVMLLGHSDAYFADAGMRVTVAFNVFGEELVQRMPRCRFGYFHVANNDYRQWGMYAVGGSSHPTINSQGNRYIAPRNPSAKEVTMRMGTEESVWESWNWRSEGDMMVNGAFFVPSGDGLDSEYDQASSFAAKSAANIDQLTQNAGVFGDPSRANDGGGQTLAGASSGGGGGGEYSGMIYSGGAGPMNLPWSIISTSVILVLLWHLCTWPPLLSTKLD